MNRLLVTFLGLVFILLLVGCETEKLPTNFPRSIASSELFENDTAKIEISDEDISILESYYLKKSTDKDQRNALADEVLLKYFAMAIAKSLKHPGICQLLKDKIGEKFDGDFEVLWNHIKDNQISGQNLRGLVNSRFSDKSKKFISMDRIEDIPLLQVSLPVNYDNWDGESTILVAYTPLTIDDMECKEIYAYDSDCNEHVLDAKTLPDFPVLVLSINERNDFVKEELSKGNSLGKINSTIQVDVCCFRLMDDQEPWYKGDPEIYVKVKKWYQSNDYFVRTNFTQVNDEKTYCEGSYSWLPKNIYSFQSPNTELRIEVWEDDSPDADDLLEHNWNYPDPETGPYDYLPNGIKEWWYGDHNNADLKFVSIGT